MDQCVTVERELEKVLQKFSGYGQLCERSLEELIQYAGGLRREILQTESLQAALSPARAVPSAQRDPAQGAHPCAVWAACWPGRARR
uniref:Uncharacterized protein n=1 Tax=Pavo cristatus TaxID=9049 RepID=A0A8C9ES04_PAVCR